jgi:deferrochelatase/peroxidase EfeB
MSHALVTVVAPLDPRRLDDARKAIEALGNPADAGLAAKLAQRDGDRGIHFVSLHALPSFTEGKAHLLLEISADGDKKWAIEWLARAIGDELKAVFEHAQNWHDQAIDRYLRRHAIKSGFGFAANPGIGHIGTPGMSVGRILRENAVFDAASEILARQGGGMPALDRLDAVRTELRQTHGDMLSIAQPPASATATGVLGVIGAIVHAFVKTYLWPWLLLLSLFWIVDMAIAWHDAAELSAWSRTVPAAILPPADRWWLDSGHAGWPLFLLHLAFTGVTLVIELFFGFAGCLIAFAAILYVRLRQQEDSDWISDQAADPGTLGHIFALENHTGYAQNHMLSLTQRKPGWLRYFTTRLVFFAIATLSPRLYKPGYLEDIGTIHFARWITIPKTRDLVFLSNYGGSWESYLEDFITLAHKGLTGVWSNTLGFPKTTNLIAHGATDGERFKRYARQSMLPTLFWYSAYPKLDTDMIRANADIRRGLSGAMTEDGAQLWLSRFGSTLRPDSKLVTTEIQSLVFGGLGFLPFAIATFWRLPVDRADARAWLADLSSDIAWNDGRRVRDDASIHAVVQLGLSAGGLERLGLPEEGRSSFPPAFLVGMKARARILGDTEDSAPERWCWKAPADATVLVYGEDEAARDALRARLDALATRYGASLVRDVPLRDLPHQDRADVTAEAESSGNAQHNPPRYDPEPFGFADGISQPLIQGTYKAERAQAHPLHIVAPGEFVLGYPDNRGHLPPGPTMPAIYDPGNLLPVLDGDTSGATNDVNRPRDLGRNGSFLVIRELEQDVAGFEAYCAQQAAQLRAERRLLPPYQVTPEFIGAKMVGRWQNGAPLVRSPYSQSHTRAIYESNAFMTGFEDPEGLRCPFGAHIRRANPRDSLNPGSTDQVAITNRHRILRVGRKYAPAPGQNPGLLFMCLNGDLERQFEFIQQTWLNGNVISLSCPTNLSGERDPVLAGGQINTGYTIPTRDGPVKLAPLPRFVTMRGGGYFFLPGKRLIDFLAQVQP